MLATTLIACSTRYTLRGAPAPAHAPREPDGTRTTLELPHDQQAHAAAIDSGWPVWIVRHGDGSTTLISAVTPIVRSGATLFAGRATLVRWIPRVRRFLAGDVIYDEFGHVLGYATDDEPASEQRDLDTFAATVTGHHILVGAIQPAALPPAVSRWVDWDHDVHLAHELDPQPGEVALAPIALERALQRPIGSYALIAAAIVQSTTDAPRLCSTTPTRPACSARSPAAFGVPPVSVSKSAEHAETETILVRRDRAGLVVIATSHVGA